MEMSVDNRKFLIFLTHSNKKFQKEMYDTINKNLKNVEVKVFENYTDILSSEKINTPDLIIVEITQDKKIIEQFKEFFNKKQEENLSSLMFLCKKEEYNNVCLEFFDFLHKPTAFDFINEVCFNPFIFINRIKVLLSIPKLTKSSLYTIGKIETNLWNFLNYSNFFILIIDKNLNIKLVNYHLSKTLGFNDEFDLTNQFSSWTNFIKPIDVDLVQHIGEELTKENHSYDEFTYDIILKDGSSITVKWFNIIINTGLDYLFSIGIPLTKEPTLNEDIDSIRSYFKDILQQDKTTINAMKEVTKKYSDLILKNESKNS